MTLVSPALSKLSALLPDLAPWRASRDFRLLWVRGLVTFFSSAMAMIALPLQIKELTNSPLAVGAMGAVELVPLVVFGLYGGALADAVDRRRVILWTEAGLGTLAAVLLVNALLPEPMLWPLYVVAAGVSRARGAPAARARLALRPDRAARAPDGGGRAELAALADGRHRGPLDRGPGRGARGARARVRSDGLRLRGLGPDVPAPLPAPPAHDAEKPSLRGIAEGARYA